VSNVLETIVTAHRAAAARDTRPLDDLLARARAAAPPRPFRDALARGEGVSVIAEVKRRSPSKGDLAPDLVPGVLAKAYEDGGAAALSVLTDAEFFGARADDLPEARAACDLPVLRKDFTVSERDVCDARLLGADAVLLIVAALTDDELRRFRALAAELGLAAVVEVHDEGELERATAAGADIVGVNQRDLTTFAVDRDLASCLAPSIPPGVVRVAESGILGPGDIPEGYDAVLVGEHLVTSPDPAAALRALRRRAP
jgi:indole-3-glycerol phosphate synthase